MNRSTASSRCCFDGELGLSISIAPNRRKGDSESRLDFDGVNGGDYDLVTMLLDQQQQLTAVEEFSRLHEEGSEAQLDTQVPAQEKYYRALLPLTPPEAGQQFAFEVDLDSCSGCKACVVACHTLNGLEEDESWRRVGSITIGQSEPGSESAQADNTGSGPKAIGVQHVTTACHHCEDPGCLNGCPVKAYDKDPVTGIVRHLDDQCIGCKYCTMMCPYEVPKYSDRLGIVRKCDMCHNRLAVGEAPACVQSCPNEAIKIRLVDRKSTTGGRRDDDAVDSGSVNQGIRASAKSLAPGAPPSDITLPTTVYVSSRSNELGLASDDGVDEVAESHWPLGALLIATQISVGMLIAERFIAAGLYVSGQEMPRMMTAVVATVSLLVGMAGLNLAPLHLGQPLRAWRVFLGLRTSWLSREAVVLGKYVGALATAVALLWLPQLSDWLPTSVTQLADTHVPSWAAKALLGLSIPIGLVGLYSSAMIYIATKRVLWTHSRTLPRFFGTTAIGGIAFAAATMIAVSALPSEWTASLLLSGESESSLVAIPFAAGLMSVFGAFLLVAKLVWEWRIHLGPVGATDHPHDRRCRALTRRRLGTLRVVRIVSAVVGAVMLFTGSAFALSGGPTWTLALGWFLTALAVLVGECAERLLYFMSVVYDRMPGTLR
ncbi:MAG: DmsC/YnfH family molybdoenzyme membrane anchor subunit [Planctomycetota bacterium]